MIGRSARFIERMHEATPNALSLLRLPLALVFPFFVDEPLFAMAIIAISGLSDVLDGYFARRFSTANPTGAILDPITDKVFSLSVVGALVLSHRLPIGALLPLFSRELLEAPVACRAVFDAEYRKAHFPTAMANRLGKLATCAQYAVVFGALVQTQFLAAILAVMMVIGTASGISYLWRGVQIHKESLRPL